MRVSNYSAALATFATIATPSILYGQNGSLFHSSNPRNVQQASAQIPSPVQYPATNTYAVPANGVQQAQAIGLPAQMGPGVGAPNGSSPNGQPLDTMSLPPMSSYPSAPNDQQSGSGGLSSSWTFIPPAQTRRIKIHDIVSIRVDESANSLLLGNATSRKTTTYDAVVKDWMRLSGLDTLKPSPQSDGDPRAQINQNEVYRGDSTLRTSESISFNIASQVVDILPNGLIVLEGNTTITLNDNSMEVSLIGTCRSEDIAPDNTVLSRNLVNKHIKKREDGHVRDGYSRGWLTRLFAKIKPF